MARARARLTRPPIGARVLLLAAALVAVPPAWPAASVPVARPTADQKRCAAAQRRVERHAGVLATLDAELARDRAARAACTAVRTCTRLDREIRSEEARRRRIAKQLAQYESEAAAICAKAR